MNRPRAASETYLEYKENLKKEQKELDKKLNGVLVYGRAIGFTKEGENLGYKEDYFSELREKNGKLVSTGVLRKKDKGD